MDYNDSAPPCGPVDRRVHWKVKIAKRGRHVSVHAEYYRIDCGVLYFRNANNGGYPTPVAVFAPGHWLELKNADIAD